MGERARGAILYGCAALLFAGGLAWWVSAAPAGGVDKSLSEWRDEAGRMLPELDTLDGSDSVSLDAGTDREVVANVGTGEFVVSVVCVGGQNSQMRITLSDSGDDSGHGLRCTGKRTADFFSVTVVDELHMNVSVADAGPVVFRYTVLRENG